MHRTLHGKGNHLLRTDETHKRHGASVVQRRVSRVKTASRGRDAAQLSERRIVVSIGPLVRACRARKERRRRPTTTGEWEIEKRYLGKQ